jgi:GR25 family glycosyltransferase involved in LPS biosynthesis
MLVYLLASNNETERVTHILALNHSFDNLMQVEAIYPTKVHVPFQHKIKAITKARTGHEITNGALGCLLSHRKIWQKFINQNDIDHCLILESDSKVLDLEKLKSTFEIVKSDFDLFFFGAFDGRMKLFRSSKHKLFDKYVIGEPLKNSLYCTYGYMLNKKAASNLLRVTSKFDYPVDYWKYRLKNTNLKVGGITPNLISTVKEFTSTIDKSKKSFRSFIFDLIIDFKNSILTSIK